MNRVIVRRFASALMAAGLIAAAAPAVAAPPAVTPPGEREDLGPFTIPAGLACDFTLYLSGTGSNASVIDFENGRQIVAGKGYLLTYTNVDTGESVTFESNGSVQRTSAPDEDNVVTVTATGSNGLILFDSDASEISEVPSAIQYTGRIVYTVDLDTEVFTLISASGRQRDLCEELS
jgi:hypothetical protein